jgi:hypothetical protein
MRPSSTEIRSIRWSLFLILSFSDVLGWRYAGGAAFLRLLMIPAVVLSSSYVVRVDMLLGTPLLIMTANVAGWFARLARIWPLALRRTNRESGGLLPFAS